MKKLEAIINGDFIEIPPHKEFPIDKISSIMITEEMTREEFEKSYEK